MEVGRYSVVRSLGSGGMAEALLAKSVATGDLVVLKIPHTLDADTKERVRDEARIGIRLSHKHVVETLDLFEHEGKPVLVVRYVDGCALKDWWELGPAPPAAVAHVGAQIADALAAIHEAADEYGRALGILHRDVAPGNVLVNNDGDALLIDLGIARSTETRSRRTEQGMLKGTLRYLAPEILEGKSYTVGTDLWALGVCLFELAVGRRAVSGDPPATLGAIWRGALFDLAPHERFDDTLLEVLKKLAAPLPERFTGARQAAFALEALALHFGDGRERARELVARSPKSDNMPAGDDATEISVPRAERTQQDIPRPITIIPSDPTSQPITILLEPQAPTVRIDVAEVSGALEAIAAPPPHRSALIPALVGALAAIALLGAAWMFLLR